MRRRRVVTVMAIVISALLVIMLLGAMFAAALGDSDNKIKTFDPETATKPHGNMWLINNDRDLIAEDGTIVFDHTSPNAPDRLTEAVAVLNPNVRNESKPSTSIGPTSRYDNGAQYAYDTFKEGLRYDVQFCLQKLYNFHEKGRGKLKTEAFSEIINMYKGNWDDIINDGPSYLYEANKLDYFDEQAELLIKDLDEQYTLRDEIVKLDGYDSSDYRTQPESEHSFPCGVIKPSDGLHGGHFIELNKLDENGNVIDTHKLRLECFYQDVIPIEVPGTPEDDTPPETTEPPPTEPTTTATTAVTTGPDKKDIDKGLNGTDMSHDPSEGYLGSEVPDEHIDEKTDLPRFTGEAKQTTTTTVATTGAPATEPSKSTTTTTKSTSAPVTTVPESPTAPHTETVTQPAVVETSPPLATSYVPATAPEGPGRFIPPGEYSDDGY